MLKVHGVLFTEGSFFVKHTVKERERGKMHKRRTITLLSGIFYTYVT